MISTLTTLQMLYKPPVMRTKKHLSTEMLIRLGETCYLTQQNPYRIIKMARHLLHVRHNAIGHVCEAVYP